MAKTQTESRKKDHVELVLSKGAQGSKAGGFERLDFVHNALPEIAFSSVNLSASFLGRRVRYPLMVSAITGGYKDAEAINKGLAQAAENHSIAFGLGSQRAMIENPSLARTYNVRGVAPHVPLLANIGAYQLKKYTARQIESLVSSVEADALAVHLNPLQEVIQAGGDTDYGGVLAAIRKACDLLSVPVVVKETGAGMSHDVALKLKGAGVKWIDVAGAGGTSWSSVEYLRSARSSGLPAVPGFGDWGIPTAESIIQCRGVLPIIASGGIRSGIDCAKAVALGADMCGAAYPFLRAFRDGELDQLLETWQKQMKVCAFLTGSKNVAELKKAKMRFI
jgi:isopentenyl-diphosphate delta-isomerase